MKMICRLLRNRASAPPNQCGLAAPFGSWTSGCAGRPSHRRYKASLASILLGACFSLTGCISHNPVSNVLGNEQVDSLVIPAATIEVSSIAVLPTKQEVIDTWVDSVKLGTPDALMTYRFVPPADEVLVAYFKDRLLPSSTGSNVQITVVQLSAAIDTIDLDNEIGPIPVLGAFDPLFGINTNRPTRCKSKIALKVDGNTESYDFEYVVNDLDRTDVERLEVLDQFIESCLLDIVDKTTEILQLRLASGVSTEISEREALLNQLRQSGAISDTEYYELLRQNAK